MADHRTEPPPGVVVEQCPSDTVWPLGYRAVRGSEQVAYGRTRPEAVRAAWDARDRALAAWGVANAEAEIASLRQRLAERAARQALLASAIDLRENAILEIEHAYGKRITPKRMEALAEPRCAWPSGDNWPPWPSRTLWIG